MQCPSSAGVSPGSQCKLWESIVSPVTVACTKRLRTSWQTTVLGRNRMATAGLWRSLDDFQWLRSPGQPQGRKERKQAGPTRKGSRGHHPGTRTPAPQCLVWPPAVARVMPLELLTPAHALRRGLLRVPGTLSERAGAVGEAETQCVVYSWRDHSAP